MTEIKRSSILIKDGRSGGSDVAVESSEDSIQLPLDVIPDQSEIIRTVDTCEGPGQIGEPTKYSNLIKVEGGKQLVCRHKLGNGRCNIVGGKMKCDREGVIGGR